MPANEPSRPSAYFRKPWAVRIREKWEQGLLHQHAGKEPLSHVSKKRYPLFLSSTEMGVPRSFLNASVFRRYISRVRRTNNVGMNTAFPHIVFVPTVLLDVDRSRRRVIEKVYQSPAIKDILHAQDYDQLERVSLYGRFLSQKMRKKGVSYDELATAAEKAYDDVLSLRKRVVFDQAGGNVILLDYDPRTNKSHIVLIDHLEGKN